jgi:hypothetical protein
MVLRWTLDAFWLFVDGYFGYAQHKCWLLVIRQALDASRWTRNLR